MTRSVCPGSLRPCQRRRASHPSRWWRRAPGLRQRPRARRHLHRASMRRPAAAVANRAGIRGRPARTAARCTPSIRAAGSTLTRWCAAWRPVLERPVPELRRARSLFCGSTTASPRPEGPPGPTTGPPSARPRPGMAIDLRRHDPPRRRPRAPRSPCRAPGPLDRHRGDRQQPGRDPGHHRDPGRDRVPAAQLVGAGWGGRAGGPARPAGGAEPDRHAVGARAAVTTP